MPGLAANSPQLLLRIQGRRGKRRKREKRNEEETEKEDEEGEEKKRKRRKKRRVPFLWSRNYGSHINNVILSSSHV